MTKLDTARLNYVECLCPVRLIHVGCVPLEAQNQLLATDSEAGRDRALVWRDL